jgi:predicted GNAT family N-acyltransferase
VPRSGAVKGDLERNDDCPPGPSLTITRPQRSGHDDDNYNEVTREGVFETGTGTDDYEAALSVRHDVFVEEQGVPEELELDEHEGDAVHFVAYIDGNPVGAARLRDYGDGDAKVERVAVVADRRGTGWGARLMDAVERAAGERGFDRLVLNSQLTAAGFYERRGYERVGEEFEEAGIPHVKMIRAVDTVDTPTDGDSDGDSVAR